MRRVALVGLILAMTYFGSAHLTFPPTGASWTRSASNPVASPTVAWEQTSLQEPDIHQSGGSWKMWAKGGWATESIGYFTSSDGLSWTHYASNPVLGNGASLVAGNVAQPSIYLGGATYYLYFNQGGDVDPNTPRYATSSDGIAWTMGGSGSYITNPGAITQWGNRTVWKEGSNWYMLQEARQSSLWKLFYATSSDGLSWTLGNGSAALSSLQPTAGYNVGGPTFAEINGTLTPKQGAVYELWFHAGSGSTSDIYHATSTDRINWTVNGPVLTHTGSGNEVDQVADPSVIQVGTASYLFYAGVNNAGQTGRILLATYP